MTWTVPSAQGVHPVAPTKAYCPAAQVAQAEARPLVPTAEPAPHLSQAASPLPAEYLPATHGVQVKDEAVSAYWPAGQLTQAAAEPAPAYFPFGQAVHPLAPWDAKVPERQASQEVWLALAWEDPGAQSRQDVAAAAA